MAELYCPLNKSRVCNCGLKTTAELRGFARMTGQLLAEAESEGAASDENIKNAHEAAVDPKGRQTDLDDLVQSLLNQNSPLLRLCPNFSSDLPGPTIDA